MGRGRKQLFFYGTDESGGGTTPATPTPSTEAPQQVVQSVGEAATNATQAANDTGNDGWKTVAEELKGLRGDIQALMNKPTQAEETPATPTPTPSTETPTPPEVHVEKPTPPERKVRRGSRKVTRRG